MKFGQLFEAIMLVCFGFSWPLNVIKAYKARTAKGTSLAFILLIITGYVCGIAAKFINHQINYVLAVYFLNLIIVLSNVGVYIRNRALDKKAQNNPFVEKVSDEKTEENSVIEQPLNYSNSLDEIIVPEKTSSIENDGVFLLGNYRDKLIPVQNLAKEYELNFPLYNKSSDGLMLSNSVEYFQKNIFPYHPEGIIIHLGEGEETLLKNNGSEFARIYLDLIASVKACNSKCRIALVSVSNCEMNRYIKAIADSEKCDYVNLENSGSWNPKELKSSVDFAVNMGLSIRKPLIDVSKILYSYAFHEIPVEKGEVLVG